MNVIWKKLALTFERNAEGQNRQTGQITSLSCLRENLNVYIFIQWGTINMLHISVIKDSVLITGQQIKLTGHEMDLASGNHRMAHCSPCYALVCFSVMENV